MWLCLIDSARACSAFTRATSTAASSSESAWKKRSCGSVSPHITPQVTEFGWLFSKLKTRNFRIPANLNKTSQCRRHYTTGMSMSSNRSTLHTNQSAHSFFLALNVRKINKCRCQSCKPVNNPLSVPQLQRVVQILRPTTKRL